jgi:hypothetical protein
VRAERVRSCAESALLLRVGFAVGGLLQQHDECIPLVLTRTVKPRERVRLSGHISEVDPTVVIVVEHDKAHPPE